MSTLSTALGRARPSLELVAPLPLASVAAQPPLPARGASRPGLDGGEALDVPSFYGRAPELATLAHWVLEEGCRMVSVLGMGGVGKSALVVRAMHSLAAHFDVVLFRSLRDAPECSALLEACLQVLSPEALARLPPGLERRLGVLPERPRSWR